MATRFVLLSFLLVGCAGAPKLTPHFLDTQLMELREYEVINSQTMAIKFKEIHPITQGQDGYGNGFFCIKGEEAKLWKEYMIKRTCKLKPE